MPLRAASHTLPLACLATRFRLARFTTSVPVWSTLSVTDNAACLNCSLWHVPYGRLQRGTVAIVTVAVLSRAVSAQIGAFPLQYRLGSLLLRAAQFFAVGCFASVVGHSLTILLVSLRPASSQNALCVRMQRQRRGTVGSGFMRGAGDHHQQWHMLRCLIQSRTILLCRLRSGGRSWSTSGR